MNPKVALVLPPYRRWYETALLSSKSGADFTLICRTRDEFYGDPKCRFRFLQPFEVPTFPSWLPPRSSARPAFYRGLTQEQLKEFDAFIVVELFPLLAWQFSKIASSIKKPLIVLTWETLSTHPFYRFMFPYCQIWKRVAKNATKIIAMTERSRTHLLRLGLPSSKLDTVYPGIDLKLFQRTVRTNGRPVITVLFVGLLEKHKGFDIALSAVLKAKNQLGLNIRFLIAGDGSLTSALSVIDDESIVYLGKLSRSRLVSVYEEADIFVSPAMDTIKLGHVTQEEQFGFSLVEALAAGLPIVTTTCGAIPEIVGEKNIIIPQRSEKDLVDAIEKLVKDPDLRLSIGERNRARAERFFDMERQSETFGNLIRFELEKPSN